MTSKKEILLISGRFCIVCIVAFFSYNIGYDNGSADIGDCVDVLRETCHVANSIIGVCNKETTMLNDIYNETLPMLNEISCEKT